jgi:hypothetical protein
MQKKLKRQEKGKKVRNTATKKERKKERKEGRKEGR